MSRSLLVSLLTVVAALPLQPVASAQGDWQVLRTFQVGGEGGWDYITADGPDHRLFVTRTTHTQVIDAKTGKVVGDIPGQKVAHGVALVPRLNRGFITDGGGAGAIVIFDLKTYAVLGRIPAMPDADGIIYDARTDRVLAVSGDGGALMTFRPDIDAANGKLDPPINLGGKPEFLAADGAGKVYINLEDKALVAVVDIGTRKVLARWPVAPGSHPVGMSIDPEGNRLFVGCRNPQKLIVMNTSSGAVEAALPIGAGVDATAFQHGQAFASCRDGSLTIANEKNGQWAVEQVVKTPDGARTVAVDPSNGRLYLPTAELEPAAGGGRPRPKPGTFIVVEVGHK